MRFASRHAMHLLAVTMLLAVVPPGIATADEASGSQKLIQQARYWEDRGRYDLANESWLKLLRVQPDHPDALASLGMNEARAGRTVPAEVYLQRLKEAHPGHGNVSLLEGAISAGGMDQDRLKEARSLAQAGNYDRSAKTYREVFDGKPPAGRLGLEYYQTLGGSKGGWEPARKGLQELAAKHPNDPEFQLAYAQHLTYRENSRRQGIQLLAQLEQTPSVAQKATDARREALIWLNAKQGDVPLYNSYLKAHPNDKRVKEKLVRVKRDTTPTKISRPAPKAAPAQKVDPLAGVSKAAFAALNSGRLAEAEKGFEQILRKRPNDADALGGLGIVRLRQERFANAVNLLERSSKVDPSRAKRWNEALASARYWVLVRRGQAARKEKNLAEAEKWYRQAIPLQPNEITPRVELADILVETGREAAAEREYRQVLKRDPDNGSALRGIVTVLQKRGMKGEALAFAERLPPEQQRKIYQLNTLKAEVLRDQAQKAEAAGQLDVAEKMLRESLFLDPSSPWTRLQLSSVYRGQGRSREAKTLIDSLLNSTDDIPDAYFIRALIAEEEQDWWGGLKILEQVPVASRTPAMADLQRRMWVRYQATRAAALARMGRTSEARAALDEITPAMAESPEIMGSVAQAYADIGDETTALTLMRQALGGKNPDPGLRLSYASLLFKLRQDSEFDIQLQHLIGDSRLTAQQRLDLARLQVAYGLRQTDLTREDGDLATAYEYLAPLLKVNPNDPRLLSALARLYNDADEKEKALGIYERVIEIDPANIDAYKGGIGAALEVGELGRAEAMLNAAMELDPANPRLYALAGQLARQSGNDGQALEYYRHALRLDSERNAGELGGPSWGNSPTLYLLEPGAANAASGGQGQDQGPAYDQNFSDNPFGTPKIRSRAWQQGDASAAEPAWHSGWRLRPVSTDYAYRNAAPQRKRPSTGADRMASGSERLSHAEIQAIAAAAQQDRFRERRTPPGHDPRVPVARYQQDPNYSQWGYAQRRQAPTPVFFARDNEAARSGNTAYAGFSGHGYRDSSLSPRVVHGVSEGELIKVANQDAYPDLISREQLEQTAPRQYPVYDQNPPLYQQRGGPVTQPLPPSPPPIVNRGAADVDYYNPAPPNISGPVYSGVRGQPQPGSLYDTPAPYPGQVAAADYPPGGYPARRYPVYQSPPQNRGYSSYKNPPVAPRGYSSYKNAPQADYSAYKNPPAAAPPVDYSYYKGAPAAEDYSAYKRAPEPRQQQRPVYRPVPPPPQIRPRQRYRAQPAPQRRRERPVAPPRVAEPRPRRPYPTYGEPRLRPAPTARVATRRARAPQDDILDEIVGIRADRSPYVAGGASFRNRDGQEGLSQLFDSEAVVEGAIPFGPGQLALRAIPTFIDAGDVSGDEALLFGTVPLADAQVAGTAAGIDEQQQDSGIALGAIYESGNFRADVGTTPIGFEVENVVGGVAWNPTYKNWNVRLEAARRAVTDSVLSWAGTVDPITGESWGGVTKNGVRGDVSYDTGKGGGVYANAGFHALEGDNVESNTMAEVGGGVYTKVLQRPDVEVTAGLNLTTFFYDKNLRQFTFGHGGYFSPQSYFSIGVPVEAIGRKGRTSYRVGGLVGWQTFQEDDAPFFPNDSDLQTALESQNVDSQYDGQSSSGVLLSAKADVEHLVTPKVAIGGTIRGDNATDFTEVSAMGYLKYYFQPQAEAKAPPKVLQPDWTQFRRF